MLARNNSLGVIAEGNKETKICEWISDGFSYLIGFMGTGTYSGEFLLYVDGEIWYRYHTSPGNRNAYVADRGQTVTAGKKVELRVTHPDSMSHTYYGTILGGA